MFAIITKATTQPHQKTFDTRSACCSTPFRKTPALGKLIDCFNVGTHMYLYMLNPFSFTLFLFQQADMALFFSHLVVQLF